MIYQGGLKTDYSAWGPYAVFGNMAKNTIIHEFHHIWQSRAMGDMYLFNYALQGVNAILRGKRWEDFIDYYNFFEAQAYDYYWFPKK